MQSITQAICHRQINGQDNKREEKLQDHVDSCLKPSKITFKKSPQTTADYSVSKGEMPVCLHPGRLGCNLKSSLYPSWSDLIVYLKHDLILKSEEDF